MSTHDECQNPGCTRMGTKDSPHGVCVGYHCSHCGLPCGMMGHYPSCEPHITAAWRQHFGKPWPSIQT